MHKLPGKITRGWRRHAEAHNSMVDYVHKTHPIPAHGHRETINGTMPPPRARDIVPQFTPHIHAGAGIDEPAISITPGYVFGAHAGGSGEHEHLPQIQAWVHEPKLAEGGALMTADPMPGIILNIGETNFIYLKVTWAAHEGELGGHEFGAGTGDHAFPVSYNLQVTGLPTSTEDTTACEVAHDHPIASGGASAVSDGVAAPDRPAGAFLLANKVHYVVAGANFEVRTAPAHPQEGELLTYILAGYVHLDANGEIAKNGDDDGLRWFLQGAIWLSKPPVIVTGTSAADLEEPIAPTQAGNNTIPGIA